MFLFNNMDILQANTNMAAQEDAIVEMLITYYQYVDNLEDQYNKLQALSKSVEVEKLCDYMNAIRLLTEIMQSLSNVLSSIQDIANACIAYITYSIAQIILKRIEILSLRIKKFVLEIRICIADMTKRLLEGCNSGKGSISLMPVIGPIITALQFVSQLVMFALLGIDFLLQMIVPIMPVSAESMAFFMTFKSFKTTSIKALNVNQSITDRLGDIVRNSLQQIIIAPDLLNKAIIVASVAAAATAGAAIAASDSDSDFSKITCNALKLKDPGSIIKLIENTLMMFFMPQALPKYEKLTPINAGYMMWLILSFEPAGKKSFGFPGFP